MLSFAHGVWTTMPLVDLLVWHCKLSVQVVQALLKHVLCRGCSELRSIGFAWKAGLADLIILCIFFIFFSLIHVAPAPQRRLMRDGWGVDGEVLTGPRPELRSDFTPMLQPLLMFVRRSWRLKPLPSWRTVLDECFRISHWHPLTTSTHFSEDQDEGAEAAEAPKKVIPKTFLCVGVGGHRL